MVSPFLPDVSSHVSGTLVDSGRTGILEGDFGRVPLNAGGTGRCSACTGKKGESDGLKSQIL